MAENKNDFSTMELNSILAEARTRQYNPSSRKSEGSYAYTGDDLSRGTTVEPDAQAYDAYDQDNFVYVDEKGKAADSVESYYPGDEYYSGRSKKPLIITLVIIGVLLIGGIIGFIAWKMSSPAEQPLPEGEITQHIVISGVDVGGMNAMQAKNALAPVENKLADSISFEVACGDKKVVLTKDDVKYSFNTDDVLRDILGSAAASSSKDASTAAPSQEIKLIIDQSSLAQAAEKVAKEVDSEPKDAKVTAFDPGSSDMFTYTKEQSGQKLKSDDLVKKLKTLIDAGKLSGKVDADVEETKPAYTEEYLKKNIKKLSSFTTYSTNTWNANENMRISLGSCNGSIIEPGATWSFNDCTGDSNLESNGYKPAGVIVQGKYTTGIGGGICQSSTTIYNAGILSGMEIVERYCHYYPSSYVDYGRDATIDYGNLDLKLKNPFKYQLFLKCWIDDDTLHAEIYGLEAEDFDEVRVSTSDPSYFSTGYTVTASRTYYKNGSVVRTEALPSSTYYFSAPDDDDSSSSSSKPSSSSGTTSSQPSSSDDPSSSDPGGDPSSSDSGGDDPSSSDPGEDPGDDPGEDPGEDPGSGEGGSSEGGE